MEELTNSFAGISIHSSPELQRCHQIIHSLKTSIAGLQARIMQLEQNLQYTSQESIRLELENDELKRSNAQKDSQIEGLAFDVRRLLSK